MHHLARSACIRERAPSFSGERAVDAAIDFSTLKNPIRALFGVLDSVSLGCAQRRNVRDQGWKEKKGCVCVEGKSHTAFGSCAALFVSFWLGACVCVGSWKEERKKEKETESQVKKGRRGTRCESGGQHVGPAAEMDEARCWSNSAHQ